MEILQRKNKEKIVLCNLGKFYIAIGKDAVLLHELIGLKLSCLKPEVCRVGFPILSLEKYTDLIQEKEYSYVVYFFDQKREELEILMEYEGKKVNQLEKNYDNCYTCSKGIKNYKRPDKYIIAVVKLYEEESKLEKDIKNEKRRKIWFRNKKKRTN